MSSSRAVRSRISAPVCSIAPTAPRATARSGGSPNTETLPASGCSRPSVMSSVVDLPAPFGPSSATVSPVSMRRSIPRTASTTPPCGVLNDFVRPCSSIKDALRAVALLELLATTAPAGVIAADLVQLALHDRAAGRDAFHHGLPTAGVGDRRGARRGVVLVLELTVRRLRCRLLQLLLRLLRCELRVEQVQHDLAADRAAELGEQALALGGVLDERILLRHRAQVHALAQVVHVLEVLAPADVDDLKDHEALQLAHQLVAELLRLLLVRRA